jgi:hypothetical protein
MFFRKPYFFNVSSTLAFTVVSTVLTVSVTTAVESTVVVVVSVDPDPQDANVRELTTASAMMYFFIDTIVNKWYRIVK